MNSITDIYKQSLRDHRSVSAKRLRENERCYDSLRIKTTEYAKTIKALQDLHRKVYEIYKNAPSELTFK